MNIEYIKIKSFGSVENLKFTMGDFSALAGKGELGLAGLMAFQLFLFYGSKEFSAEVVPYLQSSKGPVAGGYAMLTDGVRRYIVAREYLNGEERVLVKDADTDIEINLSDSPGMFFFSRSGAEFMHGSEGAPVDISDILKTSTIKLETTKINANEILMLRDRLDALGTKQMRLGAERMAARGINPSERLTRAREVQRKLLENETALKNIGTADTKKIAMKKKTFITLLVISSVVLLSGLFLLLDMHNINIDMAITFFIALILIILGATFLIWLGLFKLVERIILKSIPDTREMLLTRRAELSEKLEILLEGADFDELEAHASNNENFASVRSIAEIEHDLENVRREMDEVREKLNEKLSA